MWDLYVRSTYNVCDSALCALTYRIPIRDEVFNRRARRSNFARVSGLKQPKWVIPGRGAFKSPKAIQGMICPGKMAKVCMDACRPLA